MARIAGITLPNEKHIRIALMSIYGIGLTSARAILTEAGIDPQTKTKDLTEGQVQDLRTRIEKNYRVEGELRRERIAHVKRLRDIGSYRGMRHTKRLPARGQRTKTNSRTVRGNKRTTMGSGRRKLEKT
ncbi:MAG: 30S ribosomal protein S13 [bacterium]|nr:30S ribosomal protein S13 [bacterium]